MKVVILCGGKGTRMREETEFKPKPLVEIGSKPVLWHIMKLCSFHGLKDFCLCLGYKGEMIKRYFLHYAAVNTDFTIRLREDQQITYHGAHDESDFTVTLADTGLEAMTGSRVRQVEKYLDGDAFMVTYGDGVTDLDIGALLAFHRRHGRLATVSAYRPQSRYGVIDLDARDRVAHFAEKPQSDGYVSMGFFVFQREVLRYLSTDPDCNLERDPLQSLAKDGQLMAYRHEGFFHPMDTLRDHVALNDLWEQGEAPWAVWQSSR
jgi:glucose-1-phosphate cytidylyltransferase